jgi:hypothetical protein
LMTAHLNFCNRKKQPEEKKAGLISLYRKSR